MTACSAGNCRCYSRRSPGGGGGTPSSSLRRRCRRDRRRRLLRRARGWSPRGWCSGDGGRGGQGGSPRPGVILDGGGGVRMSRLRRLRRRRLPTEGESRRPAAAAAARRRCGKRSSSTLRATALNTRERNGQSLYTTNILYGTAILIASKVAKGGRRKAWEKRQCRVTRAKDHPPRLEERKMLVV